ncbi:MAG: GuaB3 family IMP dehydrogenase-related protein [Chloroflexi bacterium]|nr:GuaB3 family IMP dehydrogenase-related protein [Chloroflexota bacterium]MDA1003046.1 GuaB3 family IMP dehydrogenase-related protein [Chloroflexota bacterium]
MARKTLEHAYGFDDVAIVPGAITTNPEMVSTEFTLGEHTFPVPIIASSMDGVVDPAFAIKMSKLGGLAVLNLDGVWTRYEDADAVLEEIAGASLEESTRIIQRVYQAPIREDLIGRRIEQIKAGGGTAVVASTPQNTKRFAPMSREAGVDAFVVASTVTTARHVSRSLKGLRLDELVEHMAGVPILVGNTVDFQATLELMAMGIDGVLIGVGPGAACTSREVLGIGMPQVSATLETAHARDVYFAQTGRYVPIITDGGIRTGGDVAKSICAGADAVMIGSPFAGCEGAPGRGYHWGMATPHAELPRGVRVKVGQTHTVESLLFGPTSKTDGTENLVGALRTSMSTCGAQTIRDFHNTRMIIAPSIKTEGKIYQLAQTRPAGI